MTLADAHIHLFAGGYPGRCGVLFPRGGELRVYEAFRRAHRVKRALVVGYEGQPWSRGNNRHLERLAARHNWISPLAYCTLTRVPRAREIAAWRKKGFAGLSWYIASRKEEAVLRACPDEVWRTLNSWRAVISVNAPAEATGFLREIFSSLPETRILMSHLGLPGRLPGARAHLRPVLRLASLPHVGVKLSGAYACGPFPHTGLCGLVSDLRNAFGEERLFWGSDFSPALDEVTFEQTVAAFAAMSWSHPDDVFSRNLTRVLARVRPA